MLDKIGGSRWAAYTTGLSIIALFLGSIMYMTGYFGFMAQEEQYISTISGYVYFDGNGNGVFDSGEAVISDVYLGLFDESGLVASNTSGVDGLFLFSVAQAGTYVVEEDDPDSWYSTTPNEVEVVIESGYTQRIFVDFGDKPYNASIIGVVFDDSDFDGVRDPGEDGIPGVGVGIYFEDNLVNQTDTDIGGLFSFTLYQPGIYEVVETDLVGWESTTDNSATVVIESIMGDVFEVIFGDTNAERSEIRCVVFDDRNADGVKGVDETGIPGVSVEFYDSESFVSSQETDVDGICSFSVEHIGEYLVVEESVGAWYSTTNQDAWVVVGSLYGEVVDVEFGETRGASIRGKVYDDDDENGVWDVGEDGLESVHVRLYRNGALVEAFTTDTSGNFASFILESGSYHLNETDLPGWYSTTPNIVNMAIELLAGQEHYVLFGDKEIEHATIHGIVYHDTNHNEEKDLFEDGISGVTVRLYEGESLVANETTDSDGSYEFSGLDPGVYEVVETDLLGWYSVSTNRVEVEVDEGESLKVEYADDFIPPPRPPRRARAQAIIESCNQVGMKKDTFDITEDVYVNGSGFAPTTTYNISVVDDVTWTDGMIIPSRVPGTALTVSSLWNGIIPPTHVWGSSLEPGKYDIVIDVNDNGVYDDGVDAKDDMDITTEGFFVIPELPLGTITMIATSILALAFYKRRFQVYS